ncbi:MAG: ABC transporter permease [Candidatus Hadarchaeum sp.]|uniref:ABC transporter permease n=1 Tax=Candidatus Hadarchaeum sp. TaxID=2883567 RepID=UPI003174D905
MPFLNFLISRFFYGLGTLLAISFIVFFLTEVIGDPAALMLPPGASAADIAAMRKQLGLDAPVLVRYVRFVKNAIRGDLGVSFVHLRPVTHLLLTRLLPTFQLMMVAIVLTILCGLPLGILAAYYQGSLIDALATVFGALGQSTPNFWLGILLILLFAVRLRWFPSSGRFPGFASWKTAILPGLTIAALFTAAFARITRTAMLETLNQDFIRSARAKGLSEFSVVLRHALKNAVLPVLTLLGLQLANLFGGTVIIETVFMWPGLGLMMVQGILNRDFPVIQGGIILITFFVILVNTIVDLLYTFFDPRIRQW